MNLIYFLIFLTLSSLKLWNRIIPSVSFTVECFYFCAEVVSLYIYDITRKLWPCFIRLHLLSLKLLFHRIDYPLECWSVVRNDFVLRFDPVYLLNFVIFTIEALLFVKNSLFLFDIVWLKELSLFDSRIDRFNYWNFICRLLKTWWR